MKSTYIIAEIGQNHNGSVDLARQLVDVAAMEISDGFWKTALPGVNAVKLVKRDMEWELSSSQMAAPYPGPHSFGATYGEHRRALELDFTQHAEIHAYARSKGLDVIETLCAPSCLKLLDYFQPDYLKVASRDLTNLPLLDAMASTKVPLIMSTGMVRSGDLEAAVETVTRHHSDITLLHCVSEYPARYSNLDLNRIATLREAHPPARVGYSDHSIGIMAPVAAVALGAQVIEKHITLDRQMKGTDHFGSLEPEGLWRMVRDIRNLEQSLFATPDPAAVDRARQKLERSLATSKAMASGSLIHEDDLCLLSPGTGMRWNDRNKVVGKRLVVSLPEHEILEPSHVMGED